MIHTSPEIVFFGTEDFSALALHELIEARYPISLIITKPDTPKGRGQRITQPKVKELGLKYGIPILQPHHVNEIVPEIKKLTLPMGILVSFGKIIPEDIINLFTPGIINLHPSLLPNFRGPSPIEAAILHDEAQTGVTIMKLSKQMDAGPVYAQQTYTSRLDQKDQASLYNELGYLGSELLVSVLPDIIEGKLQPTPQNEKEASYCPLLKKNDGVIDWNKPAYQLEREIRAYSVWPKSHAQLGRIEVIIRSAKVHLDNNTEPGHIKVVESEKGTLSLFVGTGQEMLEITSIQPLGKKEMLTQAFLSGYRDKL